MQSPVSDDIFSWRTYIFLRNIGRKLTLKKKKPTLYKKHSIFLLLILQYVSRTFYVKGFESTKRDLKVSHHRPGTEQLFKVSNIPRPVERQKMQIQGHVIKKAARV